MAHPLRTEPAPTICATIAPMKRMLGLDVGARRTGVALSDPTGAIASPLTTIARSDDAQCLEAVTALAREHEVEAIVVGLPVSLDGELHSQGREVAAFIDRLRGVSPVPVAEWNEQFTTAEAERLLRQAGRKPSRDRGRVDAVAAAVILQDYLDAHRPSP